MSFYVCSDDKPDLEQDAQADADLHQCAAGWLDEDDQGRARPRPVCKQALVNRLRAGAR